MKYLLKFFIIVLLFSFTVHAQPTLDSLMSEVSQVSSGSELEILNHLSTDGNLDQSVPKRTISTSYGTKTIFVFNLGSDHESAFDEIVSYYQNDEGFALEASNENNGNTKGIELKKGTNILYFIKKDNILVEYKFEETADFSIPAESSSLAGNEYFILIVPIILAIVAFAGWKFMKKKKPRRK